jgi:hypothetical protein
MLKGPGISRFFTFDLKSGYHLVDIHVYFGVKLLMGSCSNMKLYNVMFNYKMLLLSLVWPGSACYVFFRGDGIHSIVYTDDGIGASKSNGSIEIMTFEI